MSAALPGPLEALFEAIATVEAGDPVDTDVLRDQLDAWEQQLADMLASDAPTAEQRRGIAVLARFACDSAPAVDLLADGDALGAQVAVCRAMGFPSLQIPNDAANMSRDG